MVLDLTENKTKSNQRMPATLLLSYTKGSSDFSSRTSPGLFVFQNSNRSILKEQDYCSFHQKHEWEL